MARNTNIRITATSAEKFAIIQKALDKLSDNCVEYITSAHLFVAGSYTVEVEVDKPQHRDDKQIWLPKGTNEFEQSGTFLKCYSPNIHFKIKIQGNKFPNLYIELEEKNVMVSISKHLIMDTNKEQCVDKILRLVLYAINFLLAIFCSTLVFLMLLISLNIRNDAGFHFEIWQFVLIIFLGLFFSCNAYYIEKD